MSSGLLKAITGGASNSKSQSPLASLTEGGSSPPPSTAPSAAPSATPAPAPGTPASSAATPSKPPSPAASGGGAASKGVGLLGKLTGNGADPLKAFGELKSSPDKLLSGPSASIMLRNKKMSMGALLEKRALQQKKVPPSAPLSLMTSKKGDVFYLPMDKLRPGITSFPRKKLERRLSHLYGGIPKIQEKLPYDGGKASRDRNRPFKVILGPDHKYCVFDDEYYEIYQDILSGAQSVPVIIGEDYSDMDDEDVFWEQLQDDGKVYLYDLDGNVQKAPKSFAEIPDSPIISNIDIVCPEILTFRDFPLARVYTYTQSPAGIRLQKGSTQFLSYALARGFKHEIDTNDFDEWNKDPALLALFTDDHTIPTPETVEKVRVIMREVADDLDSKWKGFFPIREAETFDKIDLNELTETAGQIAIIREPVAAVPDRRLNLPTAFAPSKEPEATPSPVDAKKNGSNSPSPLNKAASSAMSKAKGLIPGNILGGAKGADAAGGSTGGSSAAASSGSTSGSASITINSPAGAKSTPVPTSTTSSTPQKNDQKESNSQQSPPPSGSSSPQSGTSAQQKPSPPTQQVKATDPKKDQTNKK